MREAVREAIKKCDDARHAREQFERQHQSLDDAECAARKVLNAAREHLVRLAAGTEQPVADNPAIVEDMRLPIEESRVLRQGMKELADLIVRERRSLGGM